MTRDTSLISILGSSVPGPRCKQAASTCSASTCIPLGWLGVPKSAVQLGRFFRTSPQGDPAIRRSIARARELNRNLGPVLGADWRRLNLAEQLQLPGLRGSPDPDRQAPRARRRPPRGHGVQRVGAQPSRSVGPCATARSMSCGTPCLGSRASSGSGSRWSRSVSPRVSST